MPRKDKEKAWLARLGKKLDYAEHVRREVTDCAVDRSRHRVFHFYVIGLALWHYRASCVELDTTAVCIDHFGFSFNILCALQLRFMTREVGRTAESRCKP